MAPNSLKWVESIHSDPLGMYPYKRNQQRKSEGQPETSMGSCRIGFASTIGYFCFAQRHEAALGDAVVDSGFFVLRALLACLGFTCASSQHHF